MDWQTRTAVYKARVQHVTGTSERIFKRSALNIRNGAGVIDKVLGSGRYRRVLEIGTYRGLTTAYMAQFCEKVITVDLLNGKLEQPGHQPHSRWDFWRDMGVADKIELKLVRDNEDKAVQLTGLEYDLAFIDAGKDDIAVDFELVKWCGTVLFHDYDYRDKANGNPVYDFVNSLPKDQVTIMDIFALWEEGKRGQDNQTV